VNNFIGVGERQVALKFVLWVLLGWKVSLSNNKQFCVGLKCA
jgi:hypothetical protein